MTEVTVVIPVGPYHEAIAANAVASCLAQTVPVSVVVVKDGAGAGAGYARNRGLEQVATPYVTFLDADDTLNPLFLERTLSVWRPGCYVYTDHWAGDKLVQAPKCAWINRTWHVITTLLRTDDVRRVGGFDETLEAFEDTDFYLKLVTSGTCGKRLAEPLFHYGDGGQRSRMFVNTPAHDRTMNLFTQKYGAKVMTCGDCGIPNPDSPPIGDPLPGDVVAIAMWAGNRKERGRATGRLYDRSGNGKEMHVAPADIDAAPHLWRRVSGESLPIAQPVFNGRIPAEANVRYLTPAPPNTFPETPLSPDVLYGAQGVGAAFNDFQRAHFPAPPPLPPQTVAPATVTPDVAKAVGLYRESIGEQR